MDKKILKVQQQRVDGLMLTSTLDGTIVSKTVFPNTINSTIRSVDEDRILVHATVLHPSLNTRMTSIFEINIHTGEILRSITIPYTIYDMCMGGNYVWCTLRDHKSVLKIDLGTGAYTHIPIDRWTRNIAFNGTYVVVEILVNTAFSLLDPETGQEVHHLFGHDLGSAGIMTASDKYIFLADSNTIHVSSLETQMIIANINTNIPIVYMMYDGMYIWGIQANDYKRIVVKIDPTCFSIVESIPILSGHYPHIVQHQVKYSICSYNEINAAQLLLIDNDTYHLYECMFPRTLTEDFTYVSEVDVESNTIILFSPTQDEHISLLCYKDYILTTSELAQWLLSEAS